MKPFTEFGDRFKKLRKQHDLTQIILAELIGVSPTTLQKWETGVAYPDIRHAMKLKDIFEISYDELIDGADNNNPVKMPSRKIIMKAYKLTKQQIAGKKVSDEFEASFFSHFLEAQLSEEELQED